MNTDDRLRRAATEMDRVTASVPAPPIGEVRRSARMRGIGVAVATAVGAVVLVGGAVLALNPGGDTTIGPASPGETTTTTLTTVSTPDSVTVRAAESGPPPLFDLGQLGEQLPAVFPASAEADIALALEQLENRGEGLRYGAVEALSLGSGRGVRGYVLVGELEGRVTDSTFAYCSVLVSDSDLLTDCVNENEPPYLELSSLGFNTFALLGALPEDASVVSLELGDQQVWTVAREGFVFMVRPDRSESAVVTVYEANGEVLVWDDGSGGPQEVADTTTSTTAAPPPADPSCSASGMRPQVLLRSDLPQPVAETLLGLVGAAEACSFDTLEAIAGDAFTASYGGDDPSDLWTSEEGGGGEPMWWLLSILDLDNGIIETENGDLYVWPAAHAHQGDWDTMPEADLEALRTLFTEEEIQGFAEFGGYYGYRVGIWENGDWSYFVAGD